VKNHFQNSTFMRDITVTAGSPRVDVNMSADWHEKHVLLKVAMPLNAHNKMATFENSVWKHRAANYAKYARRAGEIRGASAAVGRLV